MPEAIREPRGCSEPECAYVDTPGVKSTYVVRGFCPYHYGRVRGGRPTALAQCTYPDCENLATKYRRCDEHRGRAVGRDAAEQRAATAKWRAANPERVVELTRKHNLKRHYGITPEDYATQLAVQGGACAICGTDNPSDRWDNFAVDHDHETGEVRGLLCGKCNKAIGLLSDDVSRLRSAIAYLQRGGVWNDTKPAERQVG